MIARAPDLLPFLWWMFGFPLAIVGVALIVVFASTWNSLPLTHQRKEPRHADD